jgi:hypothetical protein
VGSSFYTEFKCSFAKKVKPQQVGVDVFGTLQEPLEAQLQE